jgi:hypothetical protein
MPRSREPAEEVATIAVQGKPKLEPILPPSGSTAVGTCRGQGFRSFALSRAPPLSRGEGPIRLAASARLPGSWQGLSSWRRPASILVDTQWRQSSDHSTASRAAAGKGALGHHSKVRPWHEDQNHRDHQERAVRRPRHPATLSRLSPVQRSPYGDGGQLVRGQSAVTDPCHNFELIWSVVGPEVTRSTARVRRSRGAVLRSRRGRTGRTGSRWR